MLLVPLKQSHSKHFRNKCLLPEVKLCGNNVTMDFLSFHICLQCMYMYFFMLLCIFFCSTNVWLVCTCTSFLTFLHCLFLTDTIWTSVSLQSETLSRNENFSHTYCNSCFTYIPVPFPLDFYRYVSNKFSSLFFSSSFPFY